MYQTPRRAHTKNNDYNEDSNIVGSRPCVLHYDIKHSYLFLLGVIHINTDSYIVLLKKFNFYYCRLI